MDDWFHIQQHLSEADRATLLGTPLRSPSADFDPSRLGAYFQTPQRVVRSLARVQRIELLDDDLRESLEQFKELLEECAEARNGLYVTF